MLNDKLRDVINARLRTKQDQRVRFPALLGDGKNNVSVPGRSNYVYYRTGDRVGEVYNERVAPDNDLPVWIGVDPLQPEKIQVLATNSSRRRYGEDNHSRGAVSHHGKTHTFPGEDTVYVQLRQFMPLLVTPTSPSSMSVKIHTGLAKINGTNVVVANQTLDLSAHAPDNTSVEKYVLIEVGSGGIVNVVDGLEKTPELLSLSDIPDVTAGYLDIAAIRLYTGQIAISETRNDTDIVDLRYSMFGGGKTVTYDLTEPIRRGMYL